MCIRDRSGVPSGSETVYRRAATAARLGRSPGHGDEPVSCRRGPVTSPYRATTGRSVVSVVVRLIVTKKPVLDAFPLGPHILLLEPGAANVSCVVQDKIANRAFQSGSDVDGVPVYLVVFDAVIGRADCSQAHRYSRSAGRAGDGFCGRRRAGNRWSWLRNGALPCSPFICAELAHKPFGPLDSLGDLVADVLVLGVYEGSPMLDEVTADQIARVER